jgi:hypothetical protein
MTHGGAPRFCVAAAGKRTNILIFFYGGGTLC